MPERFSGEFQEPIDNAECLELERKAWQEGLDAISLDQQEKLRRFANFQLGAAKNGYEAMQAFEVLQDFDGLKKTADLFLAERPKSHDLPQIFTLLEDHESLRKILNQTTEPGYLKWTRSFDFSEKPLHDYVQNYLKENKTPVATGGINRGIDLVAIRNLAKKYDVAVPIARGGLMQGAIADLWDMPTKIVDVAAHNRKVARGRWVNPVSPEDFSGKKVLLLDKDAVTGASVRKAIKMLENFKPAEIAIYFTHNASDSAMAFTKTQGLPKELKIYYPNIADLSNAGDAYIEAHEKLGTLYGRRRLAERKYEEVIQKIEGGYADVADALRSFLARQLQSFDSLNQLLPGVSEIREKILSRMELIYRDYQNIFVSGLDSSPQILKHFIKILTTTQDLPIHYEEEIVRVRYSEGAAKIAKDYSIENPHNPSFPLAAFAAARKAVSQGYEVALIVAPEGLAYAPYFQDMGIETIAVNIPESGADEQRTLKILDKLTSIKGKKVLVVEDDVRTGATLEKLLEYVRPEKPYELGLYLGQPAMFQEIKNIPSDFKETYLAETDTQKQASEEFQDFLSSKGLSIFKSKSHPKQSK